MIRGVTQSIDATGPAPLETAPAAPGLTSPSRSPSFMPRMAPAMRRVAPAGIPEGKIELQGMPASAVTREPSAALLERACWKLASSVAVPPDSR